MCANYRSDTKPWPACRLPDFAAYGEATVRLGWRGRHQLLPPRQWVPACFGLVPAWAKDEDRAEHLQRALGDDQGTNLPSATRGGVASSASSRPRPSTSLLRDGQAVRWRIGRPTAKPMGIAGCLGAAGERRWPAALVDGVLTINADDDPLFRRFHRPDDEKRSVVILPRGGVGRLVALPSEDAARALLVPLAPSGLEAAPRRAEPRRGWRISAGWSPCRR